jgi:hypothetical protein
VRWKNFQKKTLLFAFRVLYTTHVSAYDAKTVSAHNAIVSPSQSEEMKSPRSLLPWVLRNR